MQLFFAKLWTVRYLVRINPKLFVTSMRQRLDVDVDGPKSDGHVSWRVRLRPLDQLEVSGPASPRVTGAVEPGWSGQG